ncbi:tRNA 2-thiouridine(34) synthase MnmA [Candidatus Nomurabacteria bacterium]|nr:tRNA 2-thiouridine(34) synthase MnmA [Candidatus Nomurabacteria bacterium]
MSKKKVFVGLSGGVDSAVSASLLKDQGYEVIGVFIKTWHPDFLECNEEEERLDAMRVAAHLNIPFLTFDLEDVYKKEVADYMINEYKIGRTPNPDVMCNKEVKFGAFLKKAISMGADYVATGHYAIKNSANGFGKYALGDIGQETHFSKNHLLNFLLQGVDLFKDQSYFLWTLTQKQLSKILFPVGNLKKTEVRKMAKKLNLPVAEKKDSQGICFLGDIDLKEFLKHYIKEKKGEVVNTLGEEIGYHDGVMFHTLGERHGFTITKKSPRDGAYYIIGKDLKKNILIVSQKYAEVQILHKFTSPQLSPSQRERKLDLENTNWISKIPEPEKTYTAQIRYHGEFLPCKVKHGSLASAKVIFQKHILVASGQSVVIYDKNVCLGGGVVV